MQPKTSKKILSLLIALALIFSALPMSVLAEDGNCIHEHDTDCGYIEAIPCGHEHNGDCGFDEEAETDCIHEHDADCGYIEAVPCGHEHDSDCGEPSLGDSGNVATPTDIVTIAAFDALPEETLWQGYDYGTVAEADIILPDALTGEDADGEPLTIEGVTWDSAPAFDPAVSATYEFTPTLPEGYSLAEGVTAPVISVFIRPEGGVQIVTTATNQVTTQIDCTGGADINGPGWAWVESTKTLTLTNVDVNVTGLTNVATGAVRVPAGATVIGSGTVTIAGDMGGIVSTSGAGDLTIGGTIDSITGGTSASSGYYTAIRSYSSGDIAIIGKIGSIGGYSGISSDRDVTISGKIGDITVTSNGIAASSGTVTIKNGAEVGDITAAISCATLVIESGATVGDITSTGHGISCTTLTIENGAEVGTITGGTASHLYGIHATTATIGAPITVSGGIKAFSAAPTLTDGMGAAVWSKNADGTSPENGAIDWATAKYVEIADRFATVEIGGTTVFLGSADDSGTGWAWVGATHTLTLNSAYTGEAINIICDASSIVNLVFSGEVNIDSTTTGIRCNGTLTINGSGGSSDVLNVTGIGAGKSLTISSGTILSNGTIGGGLSLTIDGNANVSVIAEGYYGITGDNVTISTSGEVYAQASGYAINCDHLNGNISISGGAKVTTGVQGGENGQIMKATIDGADTVVNVNGCIGELVLNDGTVTVTNVGGVFGGLYITHNGGTLNGKAAGQPFVSGTMVVGGETVSDLTQRAGDQNDPAKGWLWTPGGMLMLGNSYANPYNENPITINCQPTDTISLTHFYPRSMNIEGTDHAIFCNGNLNMTNLQDATVAIMINATATGSDGIGIEVKGDLNIVGHVAYTAIGGTDAPGIKADNIFYDSRSYGSYYTCVGENGDTKDNVVGNLTVYDGEVVIFGNIVGDLTVNGGEVWVYGNVTGNVTRNVGGAVHVDGTVGGTKTYWTTVRYNLNGGTGIVPTETDKAMGETFAAAQITGIIPPSGKQFKCWSISPNHTNITYAPGATITMGIDQLHLYAIWEDIPGTTYAVTYDLNEGGGTTPTEMNKVEGATFAAAQTTGITAPSGKQFKEWNTAQGGTGTAYAPGATVTMPGNALTLYAIWEDIPANTYTVTYHLNGGSGTLPTEADKAEGATFAAAAITDITAPSGKQFKQWNTAQAGTGTPYAPGETVTMPGNNLTLYAIWEDASADTTPPTLSDGSVQERNSDTLALIYFTSSEAGDIYYLVKDSGAAPTKDQVQAGTQYGSGASAGFSSVNVTLTAGAKDVYIVVVDAVGNISEPLKVSVDALKAAEVLSVGGTTITSNDWTMGDGSGIPHLASVSVANSMTAISANEITVSTGASVVKVAGSPSPDPSAPALGTVSLTEGTPTMVYIAVQNGQTKIYYRVDVTRQTAGGSTPTVTNVTVSPSAIEVRKGTTQQFAATVTGTNNPATTVTWSVNSSAGSTISESGLLTVAAGETAATLTVTATSTADTSKSGTAAVTVTAAPPAPSYGITLDTSGTHTFPAATAGYGAQTAKSVTITNTGNRPTGALTIVLSDTGSFTLSKTDITDIANGGKDTFTVTPNTDLAAGTYTATVTVNGSNVTAQSFSVSFTVNPAASATYTVTFNPNGGIRTGGGELVQTVSSGGSATAPTVTRSGYTFNGWDKSFANVTGDMTVNAQWTQTQIPSPGDHDPINPPTGPHNPNSNAIVSFEGDFAELNEIKLNGQTLTQTANGSHMDLSGYTGYTAVLGKAESGSVKVTLYAAFLKTLPNGTYTLSVSFNDGGEGSLPIEIQHPPIINNNGGSGSGGSSGGGGGGGSNYTAAPTRTTLTVDAAKAKTALEQMQKAGKNKAHITNNGEIKVLPAAWKTFGNTAVDFDTIEGGAVQVRITVKEPGKITKEMLLSGEVSGSAVNARKAFFEKWFKNKVRVLHLDQTGDWGQPVEIAAKVDLTGMDTANLHFYSYDKATNTYRRIEKPAYWIDKNGYLHFYTELAGDIIISNGPLEKK